MGGHLHGERASGLAVKALTQYVLGTMPWFFQLDVPDDELKQGLKAALRRCQHVIDSDVHRHPSHKGMGTTLTMAYILWPRLYVVHAGDSRCYLCHQGRLEQITRDHRVLQVLLEQGAVKPEDAEKSPLGNVLSNAIVGDDKMELQPDIYVTQLTEGDQVLLCTDGLTAHVDDAEITGRLRDMTTSPHAICQQLIDAAKQGGGSDNITVVLARTLNRSV
jgi:protein phosphatase